MERSIHRAKSIVVISKQVPTDHQSIVGTLSHHIGIVQQTLLGCTQNLEQMLTHNFPYINQLLELKISNADGSEIEQQ